MMNTFAALVCSSSAQSQCVTDTHQRQSLDKAADGNRGDRDAARHTHRWEESGLLLPPSSLSSSLPPQGRKSYAEHIATTTHP